MIWKRAPKLPHLLLLVAFALLLASVACRPGRQATVPPPTGTGVSNAPAQPGASKPDAPISLPAGALPSATVPPSATQPATSTPFPIATWVPSRTPTVTLTATSAPTATYAILRGRVLVRANCRYGPGAPYLYKYGLVPGSNLEVIGRTDSGTWILVRAIGGNNPCWVKASLMAVNGDIMSLALTYLPLPQSPYYAPPTGVSATRNGNEVSISWNGIAFRAGDETASPPYLVEVWSCSQGQLVFTPIGTYITTVKVSDEPGCAEPSHGRVFGVEKHGYTRWVEVPWPAHE